MRRWHEDAQVDDGAEVTEGAAVGMPSVEGVDQAVCTVAWGAGPSPSYVSPAAGENPPFNPRAQREYAAGGPNAPPRLHT